MARQKNRYGPAKATISKLDQRVADLQNEIFNLKVKLGSQRTQLERETNDRMNALIERRNEADKRLELAHRYDNLLLSLPKQSLTLLLLGGKLNPGNAYSVKRRIEAMEWEDEQQD